MTLAALVRRMAEAGAPPEAIAVAVEAVEVARAVIEARLEAKREGNRERQRRHRSRVTERDVTRDVTLPAPPKKERVPPTPPLQEKTPSPLIVADATIVDEPVDASVAFEKTKKNTEALKAFGEEWNRLAAALSLPSIDEIKPGSTRERQALARLREMAPDGVQTLMTRIRGSPYLRGEINGFRVSFDWIIKLSNYQKIMEGNYENRKVTSFRR